MKVLVLSFWTTARCRLQIESDLRGVVADTGILVVESVPPTKYDNTSVKSKPRPQLKVSLP